jgi:hypothetical protein
MSDLLFLSFGDAALSINLEGLVFRIVYFEKIRVFKAGVTGLEYISMG